MRVEAGKTLLVAGAASVELLEGEATILGAPLDSAKVVVARGKQAPIETRSPALFNVALGRDAGVETLDGSTIPYSWREASTALAEMQEGTAIVAGGVDSGKTTLCTFLANCLVLEHRKVAVVDADIGQTDLGPPTTMAAGEVTRAVANLSQIEPSEHLFIGSTSPGRVKTKVIRGIRRLVDRHSGPGRLVIVNTDGWIDGEEAVEYKAEMFKEVQPTITLGIGDATRISQIVELAKQAALLVGSPDTVKERTRLDRRELRTLGYRRYLTEASVRTFPLDSIRFCDSISLEPLSLDRMSRSRIQFLRDSIVGLLDADDYLQEIGILREISPATGTVKILCRSACAPVKIEVGTVKLDKDAHEMAYT